jgi:hypothetical protein
MIGFLILAAKEGTVEARKFWIPYNRTFQHARFAIRSHSQGHSSRMIISRARTMVSCSCELRMGYSFFLGAYLMLNATPSR